MPCPIPQTFTRAYKVVFPVSQFVHTVIAINNHDLHDELKSRIALLEDKKLKYEIQVFR